MSEFERDTVDAAREHARMGRASTLRSYLIGLTLVAVVPGLLVGFVWLVSR